MAKVYVYTKVKELGKLNDNSTLELGHYTVDGKVGKDKIYWSTKFTRKNGTEDCSRTAICTPEQAKTLGELLMKVEVKEDERDNPVSESEENKTED